MTLRTPSLLIIIDWFGAWPAWFPVFLASCGENPSIDWLIHTDNPSPRAHSANVRFRQLCWKDYTSLVSERLDIDFKPDDPYSICNVRPAFGEIYPDILEGYDFFGYGDMDVVYGDLRKHYGAAMRRYDVISNDARICSGHLFMMRNVPHLREAFRLIPDWRKIMQRRGPTPWRESIDESRLTSILHPDPAVRHEFSASMYEKPAPRLWRRSRFKNEWVTPFVPSPWLDGNPRHPEVWRWHGGRISNNRDAGRDFPYLHLMNFNAKRYVNQDLYGDAETWSESEVAMPSDLDAIAALGVQITRNGIVLAPHSAAGEL